MRIVAADAGAAVLDSRYEAETIVAAAAVLVEPPFREPCLSIGEPVFMNADDRGLILREVSLCRKLLKRVKADVVHVDMSLRGLSLDELSPARLHAMRVSSRSKDAIRQILPDLRRLASTIKRAHGIEALAIGKESVPVRIAELTAGAYATIYASKKAVEEDVSIVLGLPARCSVRVYSGGVLARSLMPAEHDLLGRAMDEENVLPKVRIVEELNPCARGFRLLRIAPKVIS